MRKLIKRLSVGAFLAVSFGIIVVGFVEQYNAPPETQEIVARRTRYCIGDGKRVREIDCVLAQRRGKNAPFYYIEAGTPLPKIGMPASGGSLQPLPGGGEYAPIIEERSGIVQAASEGGGAPDIPEPSPRVRAHGSGEEELPAGARRPVARPVQPQPMHH